MPDGRTLALPRRDPEGQSRNKYEWDEELQAIKLDRFLFSSVVYPTDYGFIPDTLGEDGDPLDAMVCVTEPTFPGCVIPVKVIALFRMRDDKGVDDKVVCVPRARPELEARRARSRTSRRRCATRSRTSSRSTSSPRAIAVKVDGWFPRDQALDIIDAAKARFRDGKKPADETPDDVEAAADESEPDDGASDDADASDDGDADATDDAADAKS